MGHPFSFEPPPAEYPNHLALEQPERLELPSRYGILVLLVLACLIPRVVAAVRLPSICIDGPTYVATARALEAGDFRASLFEGALNIYPVILALFHHIGFAWETAAAVWGVTASTLVILPLWGWVRRQFDDRVALGACLLYIAHPKFVLECPEVMRDPTFWLFFSLTIYCMWRAVTEVRYGYFIAAGAANILAVLTRVEGVFLLIPLVLWTFWRCLALRTDRRKLLLGTFMCVFLFPAILLLTSGLWMACHGEWIGVRLEPLMRVQPWIESLMGCEDIAAAHGGRPPLHVGRMLWMFFPTMTRGLAPVFALLMFGGIWKWRRVWSRRDHQALFCTALVIMLGIWVQLWVDQNISRRYALPIVIMASPFASLALWALAARASQLAAWLGWQDRNRQLVAGLTVGLVMIGGLGHAVTHDDDMRQAAAHLGIWAEHRFSPSPTVLGPLVMREIVTYYAGCVYLPLADNANDTAILDGAAQTKADVVVLRPSKHLAPQRCDELAKRLEDQGMTPADCDNLSDNTRVLVRSNRLESAQKSALPSSSVK